MRAARSTCGYTNAGAGATRVFALVMVACVSWQCAPNQDRVSDVRIVTTIYPLKMIVSEITGRTEAVACLLPPGASPHTFEPLASDLARIQDARLFVRVGGALDSWAVRMLAAMNERPTTLTLVDIEGVRLIHRNAADRHAHEGDDHHFDVDPHMWLDPLRVRDEIVPAVTEALARMEPDRQKITGCERLASKRCCRSSTAICAPYSHRSPAKRSLRSMTHGDISPIVTSCNSRRPFMNLPAKNPRRVKSRRSSPPCAVRRLEQ